MRESFKLKSENDEMINEKIGLIQQKRDLESNLEEKEQALQKALNEVYTLKTVVEELNQTHR